MRRTAALLVTLAACAAQPPPPKPAPAGAAWRTLHQGYVAAEASSSTTQSGSYRVTTTHYDSKQRLFDNARGPREAAWLVRGATVTRARLSGGAR